MARTATVPVTLNLVPLAYCIGRTRRARLVGLDRRQRVADCDRIPFDLRVLMTRNTNARH